MSTQQKKNNAPNKKTSLFYGIIFILLIVSVVMLYATSSSGEEISYGEFQQMVYNDEIAEIDVEGSVIRIRAKVDGVAEDDFPTEIDYYVTYINSAELVSFVDTYNMQFLGSEDETEAAKFIYVTYDFESASFIETIWPYLSMIAIIIFAIFIFKMFASQGKGAMPFGKSKAKMVISSKVRFADVAGADEEKQELKEVVEFMKNPQKFTELGAKIPKGVLLVGNPGTGKTLLAKAVAGESKVPFFTISGSDFVEMYVGVGASRVRDLFDNAKRSAPCIIFIDEIDAVGRQRGAGMGGGNDEREQTLNQLLVEMDGFESNEGIIVLAATNRSDVLDPALLRPGRFDRQIYVHLPDVIGREQIIKIHSKNKPLDADVDFGKIARLTSGFAGADIANLLNEAAILAARDDRDSISMIDVTEGINKVLMGPQKKSRAITKDDKHITAIHEGGHAIVAFKSPKCDKVQEISVIPRGSAGGYTLTLDEIEESYLGKEKLLQSLTMMLGGRAAEEIMLNDITTGASNDMMRATSIARKMVTEWGMSDALGLVSLASNNEIFVGRDYQKQQNYSEDIAAKIDTEVQKIISAAYDRAKKILLDNKDILENLAILLEQKETIYGEEFARMFEGVSVEELIAEINAKEEKRVNELKEKRELAQAEKLRKANDVKLNTAEQLFKAGIISETDYKNAKKNINDENKIDSKNDDKDSAKTDNDEDSK